MLCVGESPCLVYMSFSYPLSPFMPLPHLPIPRSLTFCPSLCHECWAHIRALAIIGDCSCHMNASIKLHLMPSTALSVSTALCK